MSSPDGLAPNTSVSPLRQAGCAGSRLTVMQVGLISLRINPILTTDFRMRVYNTPVVDLFSQWSKPPAKQSQLPSNVHGHGPRASISCTNLSPPSESGHWLPQPASLAVTRGSSLTCPCTWYTGLRWNAGEYELQDNRDISMKSNGAKDRTS